MVLFQVESDNGVECCDKMSREQQQKKIQVMQILGDGATRLVFEKILTQSTALIRGKMQGIPKVGIMTRGICLYGECWNS